MRGCVPCLGGTDLCDWHKSSSCNDGAHSKLLTQVFLEGTQRFVYLHSVGADLITSELVIILRLLKLTLHLDFENNKFMYSCSVFAKRQRKVQAHQKNKQTK